MSLLGPGLTVTVQRTVRDRFGDATYTDHHEVPGCLFSPERSREETDRRETVVIPAGLYAPPGADIRATDRLLVPGQGAFQVRGQPGDWTPEATGVAVGVPGWEPGIEVALERVVG